ncbi:MAG TPA: Spy/CpxP family protein refolding chaperone [Burkholderiales bacterium]|nr:Spy/CpxP family protein refolding chaperone [Burkholderiales bacterium]
MKSPALKILVAALALAAGSAMAQGYGYGPGYGPGMRGYGPGMMGGGYGPGWGGGMFARLNLTDEQQDKVFAIQEQHRSKNFGTMSKMRAETFKLQRMLNAENADSKAIVEQQKKVDDLRREMLASRLEMRKDVEKVLTPEQRKEFRQFGPWWAREDAE